MECGRRARYLDDGIIILESNSAATLGDYAMFTRSLPFTTVFAAASVFAGLASPAGAATLYEKFYSGQYNSVLNTGPLYTGPYSGVGSVYTATRSLATDIPSNGNTTLSPGDSLSPSVGATLNFSAVKATAIDAPNVLSRAWDDLTPNFAGLGSGFGTPSDSDQIAGSEVLTITFNGGPVKLTGIATLFDGGHTPFTPTNDPNFDSVAKVSAKSSTIDFLLSVDGGAFKPIKFLDANTLGTLALIGTIFAFEQDPAQDRWHHDLNPEFYVGALAYETCGPAGASCAPGPTPIPGALPLFATGLGVLGTMAWRRKRKAA